MKMSTYLVAFVVGKLETTETVDVDGVPLRVVCTPGKLPLAEFALEVGAFALRFFTEYFNIPYPGDKVDLVAIPDFAAGAMENLGCITFRDTALLIDKDEAARAELERVADVIAHELAHMWFGDLVTMGWWEGIWLNEAFATFMETLCVDAFRPSWDRWIGFAPSREAALAVDALHLTRPIEYPVGPPKEAEGMFDVLTYEKGCGVLRMLEQHIGAEVFRDGVRTYLKAHAYGNTVTSDLWDALEDASGAPVRDVMDTFILQGGHPLVSLHGDTLSQQPFALGPVPAGATSSIGKEWRVPVAVRALPADGEPGAPVRHLVLEAEPEPIAEAGAGPRRRQRRRLGHLPGRLRDGAPDGAGRAPARAHAPGAGQPAGRHLGHHPRRPLHARGVPGPGLAARRRARARPPGPPSAARCVLTRRIAPAGARGGAPTRRSRALIGPTHRRLGFDAIAGRERPHADAARARHQPHGDGGRRPRGPGRGGASLRRLADRRRHGRSDPARHRVGHAGRRVAAPAARRLRRAAGALPDRGDAAGGDALPRRARRLPRRRPVPAHLRPGHDRGAQPERVRRPRLAPGQPRRQPGGVDPADRELGGRARPLPEERAAPHHRVDPRPVRRRRIRRGGHRLPRRPPARVRPAPGGPVDGAAAGQRGVRRPRAGRAGATRCGAAGTPAS